MSLGPLIIDLQGTTLDPEEARWLAEPAVGGVILFARNFESLAQLEALVAAIRAVRSPELLITIDQEGGRVQRIKKPLTRLPPMRALGYLYDTEPQRALEATKELGWLLAAELRAVNIDLSFTPVVDVDRGLADVIGDRAFHDDAAVVAKLAVALAKGAKEAGMSVVAKHFPTHAGAVADSHTALATDARDYPALLDDLVPYRQMISAGLPGVMAAHVSFPSVDPLPASFSSWWLRDQLRGELGFQGAVFSDDLTMAGAGVADTCAERAEIALEAGCDVVLVCNCPEAIPATIERLNDRLLPASHVRLVRLRGQSRCDWQALRAMPRWQEAVRLVATLDAPPDLELRG